MKKRLKMNPRSSDKELRAALLTHTPIGSLADDVLSFINERLAHSNPSTVMYRTNSPALKADSFGSNTIGCGTSSIHLMLGSYGWMPLVRTYVFVWWAFDDNNLMIDVYISRGMDGP